jgi:hypothetical protein
MVHKTSIIPGLSKFIDSDILSQYPPTSMKRIAGAVAASLFLKNNEGKICNILGSLGLLTSENMIDIESARDVLKAEISKAGFMRITFPVLGDIDFTAEDMDVLYRNILAVNQPAQSTPASVIT